MIQLKFKFEGRRSGYSLLTCKNTQLHCENEGPSREKERFQEKRSAHGDDVVKYKRYDSNRRIRGRGKQQEETSKRFPSIQYPVIIICLYRLNRKFNIPSDPLSILYTGRFIKS